MTNLRRPCRGCFLSAAALLLLTSILLALFTWGAGRYLVVDDELLPADAIVILGGESGRFSRTEHGLTLYKAGHAPLVVFSGGRLVDFGVACSSAHISLEAARDLGLADDAFLVAPEAQSTYNEAVNLSTLAAGRGWRSLLVVTDPFHTRRAALTFRALLPAVDVRTSAAPSPLYDAARWWRTEQGLIAVLNEYIKLAFYWVRHGVSPFPNPLSSLHNSHLDNT